MVSFDSYQSPFTWRYASPEMRQIWSEDRKRLTWRRLWLALAEAQQCFGLVTLEQVQDLKAHSEQLCTARSLEIETQIKHDLMAEVKAFAEQCPVGGGIIHLGATSMDIKDNADILLVRQSLWLIQHRLADLLRWLAGKIEANADVACIAFTHLQPAEPTTLGYRLAVYAQDLLMDWEALGNLANNLKGKGFKGAVGTGASYVELLGAENYVKFDELLSQQLELSFFPVTNQTYPRKQDVQVISVLADLAGSLYRMAFDIRLLQSPMFGEISEPFGTRQVGSSAMPFKRNPIALEEIDSLARALSQMPKLAWDNAAHSLLERTLDDSANRRTLLPESFLIADEILLKMSKVVEELVIHKDFIQRNLAAFAPFAAIERVMMALVKAGADRQVVHEKMRNYAMAAWENSQSSRGNLLFEMFQSDDYFLNYLPRHDLARYFEISEYMGIASKRAREMANSIFQSLADFRG